MNRPVLKFSFALVLVLGLTSAFGADDPPSTRQDLTEKFNLAYTNHDFIEAIRWGLKLEESRPNQPLQQYNLACVYALVGNDRTAFVWLRRSIDNRFRWPATIENDSDLSSLRENPLWAKILAAVRANAKAYDNFVRKAFSLSPPLVALPSDYDPERPAPLIIALHGYGGRPNGYPAQWRPAAEKIGAILATPHGLQRLGEGYFWGGIEEAEIIVKLTIEYVRQTHAFDEESVVLTGFSQGGFMAMAIGARNPDLFAGIIPMAGGYRPEIDAPPPVSPESPRYFFMVGSRDEAKEQCRKAFEAFDAAGYTAKLRIYPGVGHTFPRLTNRELGKALKFVLNRGGK